MIEGANIRKKTGTEHDSPRCEKKSVVALIEGSSRGLSVVSWWKLQVGMQERGIGDG